MAYWLNGCFIFVKFCKVKSDAHMAFTSSRFKLHSFLYNLTQEFAIDSSSFALKSGKFTS